jgi:hypothetical protein
VGVRPTIYADARKWENYAALSVSERRHFPKRLRTRAVVCERRQARAHAWKNSRSPGPSDQNGLSAAKFY